MADAALTARTLLWQWLSEVDDPDPEQRGWKVPYLEGLVDACEHTGLLAPDEVAGWRRLLDGGDPPPARGDRAAAERHLHALLEDVQPMSRDPQPGTLDASRRFHAALGALHAAGVLNDDDQREWGGRGLAREAPWLDPAEVAELSVAEGLFAIGIPPATPEEEAADAAAMRDLEVVSRRGPVRAVYLPERVERSDGLAVVAVVTRADATDVVFHQAGAPQHQIGPAAPSLADDAGTAYEPVLDHPISSHGMASSMTGVWRYQPAAPDAAMAFEAVVADARWCLVTSGG